ncbi:MAG TPA: serine hydrolase domain-containing protein [Actinophytocola sp.]|jgi:CubicO group peptidase (beta-lactamase class C family)|uniref:serine hydrolase domain-containing protein n=1 Tax=Actinophytocola sp. TaxID=1872138 RepID=UPI002E0743E6|nr:serine hydrolase domain-containing protein [Actinophytocola sp.]
MEVNGTVGRGFEAVAEAFAANFETHGEIGAAVCVYRHGRAVVDIWAGLADRDTGRPWESDTPVLTFSSTKGFTAACVHLLVERGLLDIDAPVAEYWPEFAAQGKADVPVRWALCHRAGVPAIDAPLTLAEVLAWDPVVAAVAAQCPEWPPGTDHGYHARTFGWMTGELVRRTTGVSLGRFLATEITGPLGLDFWVGLPAEIEARVAPLYPPGQQPIDPRSLLGRVMFGPSNLFARNDIWNRPELHAAEFPSSNGIGTAHALARHYAALIGEVDGIRTLRPETVAAATKVQADGQDRVLGIPTRFALGFMLDTGGGPNSFGHAGSGGSLGLADPDAGIGFGYVMNRMIGTGPDDGRAARLVEALYRCL